ncbi:MAG TPA: hypothetical protein VK973_12110, partial [Arenicellales bacterium]|nr:hypothetical protein [Arenicellales bacterium]
LAPNAVREARLPRRWLKRGRFRGLAAMEETALLAHAFGIDPSALAAAPLHYLGMTGSDPQGYCLFAWPVYLHARREQLVLMTGEEFEPDEQEAEEILVLLGEYYPHWRLERTADGMWFIITDETPDLQTTPLETVLGENINDHLPRGADAMHWLRAMNELQMILFDSEVNRRREAEGRPPVNSLWFWGGGRLPDVRVEQGRRLVTNDPVALGVGRRAGMETRWLDDAPEDADISEPGTLWVQAGGGQRASAPAAKQWDALAEAMRRGDIERLVLIDPGHGELVIESRHTRSWLPWR